MVIKTDVTPEEKAIITHNTMQSRDTLTEEEQLIDKEAVRIMTACKATEPSQMRDSMRRRQFAEKKISDLTEQEKRLKKDYHNLKFIEKHIRDTEYRIEQEIYRQSKTRSLDDLISHANRIAEKNSKNTEIFVKNSQKGIDKMEKRGII